MWIYVIFDAFPPLCAPASQHSSLGLYVSGIVEDSSSRSNMMRVSCIVLTLLVAFTDA